MAAITFPYMIVLFDGEAIQILSPGSFGGDRADIEAIIARRMLGGAEADPAQTPARRRIDAHPVPHREIARAQGYTGDCCTSCGQFTMRQAGHCLVCAACGTTTGCS